MSGRVKLIIGLLGCFAVVGATPALFSREKVTTYNYYAEVKTGTTNPAPFASQFAIHGLLHVIPDINDASLNNAFYIALDLTHGVRNGKIEYDDVLENTLPLPEAAKALKDPFLITFDDNGKIQSMTISKEEPVWSRNMKQSIASTLQLDISSMDLTIPVKPHSLFTKENTIYGKCSVSYDIDHATDLGEKHFTVTKFINPASCSKFHQYTFNFREPLGCLTGEDVDGTFASRRIFDIEYNEKAFLIKKVVTHGEISYVPWNANSDAYYVLADQIITFKSKAPVDSNAVAKSDINTRVVVHDISFQKSQSRYAPNAGIDHTYGRHVVNLELLVPKLMKLLEEAIHYFDENNLEIISPDPKQGQTISRILHTIEYMDIPSLEKVYNTLEDKISTKKTAMRNIFLHTVVHVGTDATVLFIRNLIRERKVSTVMAVVLLYKLPLFVRVPTQELLLEMEYLLKLGDDVDVEIRKSSIFCFATFIYKTQKYASHDHKLEPALLDRYVHQYFDHVMSEPDYVMKLVYIQAMRNINFGGVEKLLEPIIRGDLKVSEIPQNLRFHAMIVNWKSGRDSTYIHNLYWPIFTNTKEDSVLRMNAFVNLVDQPPKMERLIKIFWFMKSEKDDNLYKFYYTMMKNFANSVDPCMAPYKRMVHKLFRFIKPRQSNSDIMSGVWFFDYENEKFGLGESFKILAAADDYANIPFCATIQYSKSKQRRPMNDLIFWVRVEGLGSSARELIQLFTEGPEAFTPSDEIKALLEKATEAMPVSKPINIEFSVLVQGQFVLTHHYNASNIGSISMLLKHLGEILLIQPSVNFDELYMKQVPNDLGLPTYFLNIVPSVKSVQISAADLGVYNWQLNASIQNWAHSHYSIEVYNPIIDASHSVKRVTAVDFNFNTSLTFLSNKGMASSAPVTVSLKYLPKHSTTGIRSDIRNFVEIFGMEKKVLEQYCPTCNLAELVTKGAEYRTNLTLFYNDSEELGLRFSAYQYNCERDVSQSPRENMLDQIFDEDEKHTRNAKDPLGYMAYSEWYLKNIINPGVSSCGYLAKLEPSIDHPTFEGKIVLAMNMNSKVPVKSSTFPAFHMDFRARLGTKKTPESDYVQSWSFYSNLVLNEGRLNNELQMQITKARPGDKFLKICINGFKTYQVPELDNFDRNLNTNENTVTNVTMVIGLVDDDVCPEDGMKLSITVDGKISEKQKTVLQYEMVHGQCQKDVENPSYLYADSSVVPRTPACLREAILRSTLLKYTYSIVYKNIPESITTNVYAIYDGLRADSLRYVEYVPVHTEPGEVKIVAEFPIRDEFFNVSVCTPFHEEQYFDVPMEVEKWSRMLDNTRFSWTILNEFLNNDMKLCTVYPDIFINADGAVTPFTFPSKWTLLTSDLASRYAFSVFVKSLSDGKFGLLITIENHEIKIIPHAEGPIVTVDGTVTDLENDVLLVTKDRIFHNLWGVWNGKNFLIKIQRADLIIEWNEWAVVLSMGSSLHGQVTGLCGHLDGRYSKSMGKVFSLST